MPACLSVPLCRGIAGRFRGGRCCRSHRAAQGGQPRPGDRVAGFAAESIRLLIDSVRKLLGVTKSCDGTAPHRGQASCRDGAGNRASAAGGRSPTLLMTLRHAPEQDRFRVDLDHGAPGRTPFAEAEATEPGFAPFALRDRLAQRRRESGRSAFVESVRPEPGNVIGPATNPQPQPIAYETVLPATVRNLTASPSSPDAPPGGRRRAVRTNPGQSAPYGG